MGGFEDSNGFFADLMKNYQQDLGANFKLDMDRSDEIPKEVVCLLPSNNGMGVFDSCSSAVPTNETGLPVSSDHFPTEADDDDFMSNFPISARDYTTEEQFDQALMLLGPQSDSESQDETSSQYLSNLVKSSSPKMEEAEQKPTQRLSPAEQQMERSPVALAVIKCDNETSSASLSQSPILASLAADSGGENLQDPSWLPVLTTNNSSVIEGNTQQSGEATLPMHDEVEQVHPTHSPSPSVLKMGMTEDVEHVAGEDVTSAELHTACDDDVLNDDSGSELDFLPSHDEKLLFRLSDDHLSFDRLPSCSSETEEAQIEADPDPGTEQTQTEADPVAEVSSKSTRYLSDRSTSSSGNTSVKSSKLDVRHSPRTANLGAGRPKKTDPSIRSSASSHSQQSTTYLRRRSNGSAENSKAREDLSGTPQRNSTSGGTTDAPASEETQPASQATVLTENSRVDSTDASWGTESLPLSENPRDTNEAAKNQSEEFEPVVRFLGSPTSAKRSPQCSFTSPQVEAFFEGSQSSKSSECVPGSTASTPIEARSLWTMLTTSRPTSFGYVFSQ
ncbi:unnamed protein product [Dibothriocephalus latus]|uniref:Uncharacterized protein n=1 Tax=Dibothriocephalus latus TaxID=60516 RepID=A0A3P7LX20_DIBLA|nr:unnamed protein product [Dibothriocephalus latus]